MNFAQEASDSISTERLMEMSFEELLNLDLTISISSSEGDVIFKTPSTISVIDKHTIAQYNFKTISEALMTVSGFTVSRTYLKRNIPTSRGILQDHYANKVLILINGVPSWNTVTGEGSLDRIDINDVERIEILKGPASVLYGTNAYSGAINLVLRNSEQNDAHFIGEVGTGESFRVGGNVIINDGKMKLFAAANSSNETGARQEFTDENNVDGFINEYVETANFTANMQIASHTLFFNTFSSSESYLGVAPSFDAGAGNEHLMRGILFNYEFNREIGEKFNVKIGSNFDYSTRDLSRNQSDDIRSSIKGYRTNAYVNGNYDIFDKLNFEMGGSYEFRNCIEYKNYNTITDSLSTKIWNETDTILPGTNGMSNLYSGEGSVYAQIKGQIGKFTALGGVRYTNNRSFGQNISHRATLVYGLSDKTSMKFIYGESFRLPSFFETNFFYSTVLGNEELEPEESKSFELSYLTSFNKIFIQLLGYYSIYENKIYRHLQNVEINDSVISINKYENGNTFNAKGIELEIKYVNPTYISGFLNYAFIYGSKGDEADSSDHYNFKYIPKHTVSAGFSKSVKAFSVSFLANYSSACKGPFEDIPSWITFDSNISYRKEFEKLVMINTISVKNISNEEILIPEYARRNVLNEMSLGYGRYIGYSIKLLF